MVPALHVNRTQVREIFARRMNRPELTDDPKELTGAARTFLREKFLRVPTAISGANFLIAETGSVVIVESEGNGRMCLTLPRTMITLAGIEKVIPRFQDLEIMLQVLARSATGERMNPYSSLWTGVTPGDGPQRFHVVLLDNGRSEILAGERERQTLKCIRCGACMNTCPVYRQTGGHAYGSVYAGPIGAILTPQLMHLEHAQTLPYASSLCGACYDVCPVKINIPEVLIDLRAKVTDKEREEERRFFDPMYLGMMHRQFHFCERGAVPVCAEDGAAGAATRSPGKMDGSTSLPEHRRALDDDARSARAAGPDVPRVVGVARARRADEFWFSRSRFWRKCVARLAARMPDIASSYAALERKYVRAGRLGAEERLALMIERLREYDAEVVEASARFPSRSDCRAASRERAAHFVVPAGLPAEWLAPGFDWKIDHGLTTAEIEKADGVVTASFCGIADSGTIVLHHSPTRRAARDQPAAGLASVRAARERCGGDAAGVFCAVHQRRLNWPPISPGRAPRRILR